MLFFCLKRDVLLAFRKSVLSWNLTPYILVHDKNATRRYILEHLIFTFTAIENLNSHVYY